MSGTLALDREHYGRTVLGLWWEFELFLRRSEAAIHSLVGVTGAVYCIRRSLWTPLPRDLICDDLFVPFNLAMHGHRVGHCEPAHAFDPRKLSRPRGVPTAGPDADGNSAAVRLVSLDSRALEESGLGPVRLSQAAPGGDPVPGAARGNRPHSVASSDARNVACCSKSGTAYCVARVVHRRTIEGEEVGVTGVVGGSPAQVRRSGPASTLYVGVGTCGKAVTESDRGWEFGAIFSDQLSISATQGDR